MHVVGFFVCPEFVLLDLAGPAGAFNAASSLAGRSLYRTVLMSERGGTVTGKGAIAIETVPYTGVRLDTVVIVGGNTAPMLTPGSVCAAIDLAARSRRITSVCTGAFLLAAAGLLDGRRATTHWRHAKALQQRHLAVKVEPDRIYVADGPVWTAAGVTAGIDLALALIEADHGVDLARAVSRELVVHHRRSGGQSQFSEMSHLDPETDRIRHALTYARKHLDQPLPVERLADAARLSARQFLRAFRRETGETPARAVERLRVEAAHARLRDGSEPVEQIACAVGFRDPERMRRAFVRIHGMSPQSIRRINRTNGNAVLQLLP